MKIELKKNELTPAQKMQIMGGGDNDLPEFGPLVLTEDGTEGSPSTLPLPQYGPLVLTEDGLEG